MSSKYWPLLLLFLVSCHVTSPIHSDVPLSDWAGLRADYYASYDFTGPKVTQIDKQIFFDWGRTAPVKSFSPGVFSVRWQANLKVDTSAAYTFYVTHNGQAALRLNGQTLQQGRSLYLEAGKHYPLILEFHKTGKEAAIKLEWSSETIKRSVLPQAALLAGAVTKQDISMAVTRDVNLLLNPDFSGGTASWLRYAGNSTAITPGRDGTGQALSVSNWAWIQQDVPVSTIEAGETYTLSGDAQAINGATCTLGIAGGSVSGILFSRTLTYRIIWQRQAVSLVLPEGTVWMAVYLASTQTECQFDNIELLAGVALPPPVNNDEIILNGGFEEGFASWGRYGGNSGLSSGRESTSALQMSDYAWVQQDFPGTLLSVGESYTLALYGRSSSGQTCSAGLSAASASEVLLSSTLEFTNDVWELKTLTVEIPSNVSWFAVYLAAPANGCLFDDISLLPTLNLELDVLLQPHLQRNGVTSLAPGPRPASAKVQLGQMLMHDKLLSGNKDISCATCHSASFKTGDARSLAVGVGGSGLGPNRQLGQGKTFIPRHAPELFNRGVSPWRNFFWDSRLTKTATGFSAPNITFPSGVENLLAAQAMVVILSRTEMRGEAGDIDINGATNELALISNDNPQAVWDAVMDRLLALEGYRTLFAAAYPGVPLEQMGFEHAANAIAAFEIDAWTLLNSPFDRYLAGNRQALSDEAKRGALLFFGQAKCSVCHTGPLLTDQQPHNIGIPQLGPGIPGTQPLDLGRFRQSGATLDRFAFRTPPLRNTAVTGPWMHNGAFTTLEQVIRHYDNVQVSLDTYTGQQLSADLQSTVQTSPAVKQDILASLDSNVALPLNLTDTQITELMRFMESLTDPAVNNLETRIPASVPSGLVVDR
jgi:cytochrome c peroxidase